jgi:DNA topoisomerase-3
MVPVPVSAQAVAKGKAAPRTRTRRKTESVEANPASGPEPGTDLATLGCPVCQQGHIIAGKRGWGCSRWREGCKFVYWFEENGSKRSLADLRAAVTLK